MQSAQGQTRLHQNASVPVEQHHRLLHLAPGADETGEGHANNPKHVGAPNRRDGPRLPWFSVRAESEVAGAEAGQVEVGGGGGPARGARRGDMAPGEHQPGFENEHVFVSAKQRVPDHVQDGGCGAAGNEPGPQLYQKLVDGGLFHDRREEHQELDGEPAPSFRYKLRRANGVYVHQMRRGQEQGAVQRGLAGHDVQRGTGCCRLQSLRKLRPRLVLPGLQVV
mmetsp:Transcript_10668/g.29575  ORF Transcript_10668/g.29575 Transcript_10668/m.29575 type:complete len:223 (+) Transcript_10668:177-845(+)